MIQRLKQKNLLDLKFFFRDIPDRYKEMYITINKERIFLKDNIYLIEKILKHQEVYGIFDKELKAIMIIYKEKGFRPYLKILAKNEKYYKNLLSYLFWNFSESEIFIKIRKNNPLLNNFATKVKTREGMEKYIPRKRFIIKGLRGQEILVVKKVFKLVKKFIPKDSGDQND